MAEFFTERDKALAGIANDQIDRANDNRHAAIMALMEDPVYVNKKPVHGFVGDLVNQYRQTIRSRYGDGRAEGSPQQFSSFGDMMQSMEDAHRHRYANRRTIRRAEAYRQILRARDEEAAANAALNAANRGGVPAAEYQEVPERIPDQRFSDWDQGQNFAAASWQDPLQFWGRVNQSLAEGVLSGLSGRPQDFLDEAGKGASILFDPQAGVDRTTLERLYNQAGGEPGLSGFVLQGLVDPEVWMYGGLAKFKGGGPGTRRGLAYSSAAEIENRIRGHQADVLSTLLRQAAKRNHPDVGGSEAAMKEINAAFGAGDVETLRRYAY